MSLHICQPPKDALTEYFKSFDDKKIEGYFHILLEAKYENADQVVADLKPYFQSAHLDAREKFHEEIGIDLHPDAVDGAKKVGISYPESLPTSARRGLFGEAFTGLLTELLDYIGGHEWTIPVFLFRFHPEVGAYLYTLKREPDRERQVSGRKGDDFIAIAVDDDGQIVRILSGEAKWRATLTQSVVDNLLHGEKKKKKNKETGKSEHDGKGIIRDLNRAIDPPHGLKQIQTILKELAPDQFAEAIFSIDQAIFSDTPLIDRTNLIVIAGNGGATRKKGTAMIPHSNIPDGYTSDKDLQVVEVIFDNGEKMIDTLYDKLFGVI